jgi:hypothetical protein
MTQEVDDRGSLTPSIPISLALSPPSVGGVESLAVDGAFWPCGPANTFDQQLTVKEPYLFLWRYRTMTLSKILYPERLSREIQKTATALG